MATINYKPILFSTEMVQALLEGRKTQTRRVVKDILIKENAFGNYEYHAKRQCSYNLSKIDLNCDFLGLPSICPYGKVGDVLWVRETWCEYVDFEGNPMNNVVLEYKADNPEERYLCDGDGWQMYDKKGQERLVPWKPSIHMPKAAARLFLKITGVRVERLQDIGECDAVAEGVAKWPDGNFKNYFGETGKRKTAVASFLSLWQKINGSDSWNANPWVWVVEFEKIDKPENFPA